MEEQRRAVFLRRYFYGQSIEQIALELAEYYHSVGNYAKVEATLQRAIQDGAGVDVYVALSKVFIEQDKLLDAVTMLSNITDPQIKAEISALRPASPTASPDPGFFNQYISYNCR